MEQKEIRFIDSSYNELFRIPNLGGITVEYPNGQIENKLCRYMDEYHTEIDGVCYHICQWAELMERNGNKFYKADAPKYTLENVTQEEFVLMYRPENENENRGCIGYIRADFDTGKSFFTTWFGENDSLKTADFKSEVDNVINYFRFESHTPLFRSRSDMYRILYHLKPTAYAHNEDIKAFKVQTEDYTYYFRCNPREGDYNLYAFCYKTTELDKFLNSQLVEQNISEIDKDKFFMTDNGFTEVYFNPNADAGGQIVYNEISFDLIKEAAHKHKNTENFFNYLASGCTQYLIDINTPEFRGNFESFVNRKADLENCNSRTMAMMKKAAGLLPEKTKKTEFFER